MTGSLHTAHHRHAPALATVTLAPKAPITVIVQRQHSIALAISPADAGADTDWVEMSPGKSATNKPVPGCDNLLSP